MVSSSTSKAQKACGTNEYLEIIKKAANEFVLCERNFFLKLSESDRDNLDGDYEYPH